MLGAGPAFKGLSCLSSGNASSKMTWWLSKWGSCKIEEQGDSGATHWYHPKYKDVGYFRGGIWGVVHRWDLLGPRRKNKEWTTRWQFAAVGSFHLWREDKSPFSLKRRSVGCHLQVLKLQVKLGEQHSLKDGVDEMTDNSLSELSGVSKSSSALFSSASTAEWSQLRRF
jgi:hypothetical protein